MPIRRGKDKYGSYFRYGNQKKYYFDNKVDMKLAYQKALKQTRAIKASENRNRGKGIDDIIEYIRKVLTGNSSKRVRNPIEVYDPRLGKNVLVGGSIISDFKDFLSSFVSKNAPPSIKNLIKNHGKAIITKITICREPIHRFINYVINAITLGKFDKVKKELGYDKFFHLFMYIELSDGYHFRIEKNERVRLTENEMIKKDGECKQVPLNGKRISLVQMFDNAIKKHDDFWLYSASKNNCQKFIYDMLNDSGLSNESINKFVKQDAETLFNRLPGYTKDISDLLTNAAAVGRRVLEGGAQKRKGIR